MGLDLSGAHLDEVVLSGARLSRANLSRANLMNADLMNADLRGIHLRGADLSMAILIRADLIRADLREVVLRGAVLSEADLSGADLRGADLRSADLRGADLNGADFSRTNLAGAHLNEANLRGTHFSGANLTGARLNEADLNEANLREADLRRAVLNEANLIEANLDGATLTEAWLWEIQRAGWSIQGIICEAAYWDRARQERTTYSPGEFERLYADKTTIVLRYEGGLEPIEVVTLPALIQRIQATHPGCVLRLQSVQEAPGGATVTLMLDDTGGRNTAELEELKKSLETTGKRLLGLQRKLLEEESTRQWAEEEIARRDTVLARLFLEQEERKLLSLTETRTKALTVMFLDLVGFSKLREEDRQAKVDMLRRLGVALLPHWNGQYMNTWGDAIVAGFEKPNDGLFLACKFIQHLAVEKIEARIGMHRGMVMVQYNPLTERIDIVGDSINVGARLEPMAHSGEVLISEELRYHPDVQEARFIFQQEQRALKKAVGDQQQGDVVECYSAKLREDAK
jgi:uncharacterized protein YjbI with pentapeptide repeats/class 3 adenylate cyclase